MEPALFEEEEERALAAAVGGVRVTLDPATARTADLLPVLEELVRPIDAYFNKVGAD